MAWRAPRGFWAYLILQVPDILLAGLVLLLLHKWMGLSSAWVLGLFALWVVKDFAMYFLMQGAFRPPLTGPETLVGARAVAMEPLAPTGHVLLFGETWRAESLQPRQVIAPGTPVIVRAIRGLTLLVEGEHVNHPKDAQRDLPSAGRDDSPNRDPRRRLCGLPGDGGSACLGLQPSSGGRTADALRPDPEGDSAAPAESRGSTLKGHEMHAKRSRVVTRREFHRASALAGPSPRGDLSGSLATRFVSLQALIPLPRSTILR